MSKSAISNASVVEGETSITIILRKDAVKNDFEDTMSEMFDALYKLGVLTTENIDIITSSES